MTDRRPVDERPGAEATEAAGARSNELTAPAIDVAASSLPSDVIGQLLGLLAHDLRNPLSALHSNLSYVLAQDETNGTDVREALRDSLVSSESLRHMINNLDVFSNELQQIHARADSDRSQLGLTLQSALRRARAVAQSHGVVLAVDTDLSLHDYWVRGALDALEPIFDNLIYNSIQYSRSRSRVGITLARSGDVTRVEIHDPGPTMDPGFEHRAFTATGQVEAKSRRSARYSRAFGLYCAALAASRCGVSITSRPGPSGHVFEVTLQVVHAAD